MTAGGKQLRHQYFKTEKPPRRAAQLAKPKCPRRRRLGGGNNAAPPKVAFWFRYEAKMLFSFGEITLRSRPFADFIAAETGQG